MASLPRLRGSAGERLKPRARDVTTTTRGGERHANDIRPNGTGAADPRRSARSPSGRRAPVTGPGRPGHRPFTGHLDRVGVRIAQLANFVGPSSGGMKTAVRALGAGYVAAGAERMLVVPGPCDARTSTEHGAVVQLRAPRVGGGYRLIVEPWRVVEASRSSARRPSRCRTSPPFSPSRRGRAGATSRRCCSPTSGSTRCSSSAPAGGSASAPRSTSSTAPWCAASTAWW